MRKPADTIYRQWNLMQRVPPHPRAKKTSELHQELIDSGFDIDIRSVQRDLDALSSKFPLVCFNEGRAKCWQWMPEAQGLEIPAMSSSAALVLQLARRYLAPILPASVLESLAAYFERADTVLEPTKLADWEHRVKLVPPGQRLIPPEVSEDVRDRVILALLEGRKISGRYKARSRSSTRTYEINPLALVIKNGILYLLCTLWSYSDVRQFALHRMREVYLLDEESEAPENFDLDAYVDSQSGFALPLNEDTLQLELVTTGLVAFHLEESRLSEDQEIEEESDDRFRVRASVSDTMQLRWWLLGFGDNVEVIEPVALRDEMRSTVARMAKRYFPSATLPD